VVFNTGMVGYVENLTDPSYKGQILVSTYPLLGNYGVQNSPPDELGLPSGMESARIQCDAVICQDYCHLPSHWNADKTLSQWLKENNVPGAPPGPTARPSPPAARRSRDVPLSPPAAIASTAGLVTPPARYGDVSRAPQASTVSTRARSPRSFACTAP